MDTQALYYLLAGALVVIGLLGVVLPALPGLPLMFAGMWLAAWAGGYDVVGVGTVIMLAVLTLLSVGVGTWLGIVFAAVLKLALAFAMLGIFVFAWWW